VNSIYLDDVTAVMGLERMIFLKHAAKAAIDPRLVAVFQKLVRKIGIFGAYLFQNVKFLFPPKNSSKRLFSMLLGHATSSKSEFREDVLRQLIFALEIVNWYSDN
jgi:hypothetical protein